ncbi:MAG: hypothetical protein JXQ65_11650 [Candidatus Marinimicrobia bacterium]|nr:hypothetical protein [Candidatus Neomarinimicrobiota bacterium]
MAIQCFDNRTQKVGDDLKEQIKSGSKIDIAAGLFTIYGYESLKRELNKIEHLRFIFTNPAFIENEKKNKQKKQFKINSNSIKKAIGGSSFEINLINEMKGKAIAKECRKWIEKKVKFKSNTSNKPIQPHLRLYNEDKNDVYIGIDEFSSVGFGFEKDNSIFKNIVKTDDFDTTKKFMQNFEEVWQDETILKDVTNEVASYISNLYKENSPEFFYYLTFYNIFDEFLEDISE